MPPLVINHPVIVLARGQGTRLADVASGRHKTTEQVHGWPILRWILNDLGGGLRAPRIVVCLREDDRQVRELIPHLPVPVEVDIAGPPGGYLPDIYACRRYGERFTVVEADTITYPGTLRNFLLIADQLGRTADLCVGVAPAESNVNGPAVVLAANGTVETISWDHDPTGLVPLGAWHWTAAMLHNAPTFAQQSTSPARYVSWAVEHGATVLPIGAPAGFNINTPGDLTKARAGVARWHGTTTEEGNPCPSPS